MMTYRETLFPLTTWPFLTTYLSWIDSHQGSVHAMAELLRLLLLEDRASPELQSFRGALRHARSHSLAGTWPAGGFGVRKLGFQVRRSVENTRSCRTAGGTASAGVASLPGLGLEKRLDSAGAAIRLL